MKAGLITALVFIVVLIATRFLPGKGTSFKNI